MSNDRHLCNKYLQSHCATFFIGGKELLSSEGTTQGDPLAMSLYAFSLQPLITLLGIRSSAKQCWYADDATGAGALTDIRK